MQRWHQYDVGNSAHGRRDKALVLWVPVDKCPVLRAARDLAPPGELTSQQLLPFEFNSVEMEHDSYRGLQVRLRCGWDELGSCHCSICTNSNPRL
jgi:Vacuolar protein sorting-associated protein 26